jgi:adenine/guanine phosphoribosyltransferase-like PRPP-binding protein
MCLCEIRARVWHSKCMLKYVLNRNRDGMFQDTFEMQADAIVPGQTAVVVDDLIATGVQLRISL